MNTYQTEDFGSAILRISLGIIWLAHSAYLKLVVFGLPGTAEFFVSIGLPAVLAYIVFAGEVVGGLALLLGIQTRVAAIGLIPIAVGATWAHLNFGWLFSNEGGGWEYPLFLTVALAAQAFLGAGAWSFDKLNESLEGHRDTDEPNAEFV